MAARSVSKKPRKPATQARSRDTVAVILEAAARILEERGLAGYNTNAVAEKAGVSIGSVYQYFPNKEAIICALVERFEREMVEKGRAVAAQATGKSLDDAIVLFIRMIIDHHVDRPKLNRILEDAESELLSDAAERNDAGVTLLAKFLAPYRATIKVPIREAAQDIVTMTRALVDAHFSRNLPEREIDRRVKRALMGYLLMDGRERPVRR